MLDEHSSALFVKNLTQKAFCREEKDGYVLIVPNGGTINEAVFVNKLGADILGALSERRTIAEVIERVQTAYPSIEEERVKKDVYEYLETLHAIKLVKIEGVDEMYQGELIKEIGTGDIYWCKEGDLKAINRVLSNSKAFISAINVDLDPIFYNPIATRARIFNYCEEFYFLRNADGGPRAMMSILHGPVVVHGIPLVGCFMQLEQVDHESLSEFVSSSATHFKDHIESSAGKLRWKMEVSDNRQEMAASIFLEAGFEETVRLKDEMGVGRDAVLLDFFYA